MKPWSFLTIALCLATPVRAEPNFELIKRRAGADAFSVACAACHGEGAGGDTAGPPLENIIGRVAGTWTGYPYSEALAGAGFVWTEAALRAWMEDNTAFLPGTKMRHDGVFDPVAQALILSYLQSISMGE
jgi:cytochrome c